MASSHSNDEERTTTGGVTSHVAPGQRIGKYIVQDRLGAGGQGSIFKVWDTSLGRSVALKLLPRAALFNRDQVQRFHTEVDVLARLNHGAIVRVLDRGSLEGAPYFVMELVEGLDLETRRNNAPIAHDLAARMVADIAHGVAHMHDAGVVHRDIKPGNILLRNDGRVLLTDFGLALAMDEGPQNLTRTGMSMGTPAFMSPEQARGERQSIGPATDIYQLGATLFSLVTGETPQRAESAHAMMLAVAGAQGPDYHGVRLPTGLRAIISKAMHATASKRYASADALARDIERWLAGEWVHARGSSPITKGLFLLRKYAAVVIIVLFGASAIGAVIFVDQFRPNTPYTSNTFSAGPPSQGSGNKGLRLEPIGATLDAAGRLRRSTQQGDGAIGVIAVSHEADRSRPMGWGDFEVVWVLRTSSDPNDVDTLTCFAGAAFNQSEEGHGLRFNRLNRRFQLISSGRVAQDLPFAGLQPDTLYRFTLRRQSEMVSASVEEGALRANVLETTLVDFSPSPQRAVDGLQVGLQLEGKALQVTSITYSQYTERDLLYYAFAHGNVDDCLLRVEDRQASSSANDIRFDLLRGLCLCRLDRFQDARPILLRVFRGDHDGYARQAGLTLLREGLAARPMVNPTPAFLRELRSHATNAAAKSEVVLQVLHLAREVLVSMPFESAEERVETWSVLETFAHEEAHRDNTLEATILLNELAQILECTSSRDEPELLAALNSAHTTCLLGLFEHFDVIGEPAQTRVLLSAIQTLADHAGDEPNEVALVSALRTRGDELLRTLSPSSEEAAELAPLIWFLLFDGAVEGKFENPLRWLSLHYPQGSREHEWTGKLADLLGTQRDDFVAAFSSLSADIGWIDGLGPASRAWASGQDWQQLLIILNSLRYASPEATRNACDVALEKWKPGHRTLFYRWISRIRESLLQ